MVFFAPAASLVMEGATASVGISFGEIGRTAGLTAKAALAGTALEQVVYPDAFEMVIHAQAVARLGVQIPADVLRKARVVKP